MPEINSNTLIVPLTRGMVALIDAEDAPKVFTHKWKAQPSDGRWYATRNRYQRGGGYKRICLHNVILEVPANRYVDHRNGNGLDCRKINLRAATRLQNMANTRMPSSNTSGFKGVCRKKGGVKKPWLARVRTEGRTILETYHATAEEAARAYDAKVKEVWGDFAWLNFPPKGHVQSGYLAERGLPFV